MKYANQKLSPWFWFSIIILAVISSIIAINLTSPTTPSENPTESNTVTNSSSKDTTTPQNSNSTPIHGVSPTSGSSSTSEHTEPQATTPTEIPSSTTPNTYNYTAPSSSTCLHEVSGLCLDDYEDEAYSTGLYDHEYGYYGTSLDYPEGCNSICQEALEDAYDEGWYDAH